MKNQEATLLSGRGFTTIFFTFTILFLLTTTPKAAEGEKPFIRLVSRGCSRFGHSCFGAHGKRGGGSSIEENGGDTTGYNNLKQNYGKGAGISSPEMLDINGGGYRKISPVLREWILGNHRLESVEEGGGGPKELNPLGDK